MRKILKSASLVALCMLATAFSAEKSANATAYLSAFQNVNQITAAKSPTDIYGNHGWFSLTGVTSLGTCGTSGGLVVFKFADADKNILATVTAAFLSGKQVAVTVDDGSANKEGTYCYVQGVVLH